MSWQFTPEIVPVLLAAAIAIILAAYAWQKRRAVGAIPFALLMLAVTGWAFGYTIQLGAQNSTTLAWGATLTYLGTVAVPTFWFLFAVQFTGRDGWLTRRNLALLAVIPLITLLLALTNGAHRLMWQQVGFEGSSTLLTLNAGRTSGLWFGVFVVYSYTLLAWGAVLLVSAIYHRSFYSQRTQSLALLVGIFTPLLTHIFYLTGISDLDLTTLGFAFGGLFIAWGGFRPHMFEVMPAAQRAVWGKHE